MNRAVRITNVIGRRGRVLATRFQAPLEFGDADRPAEPSARPAFDATMERAVEAAADMLQRAVEGVTR